MAVSHVMTSRPEAKHSMAPPAAPETNETNAAMDEPAAEAATAATAAPATASAAEVAMNDAVPRMTKKTAEQLQRKNENAKALFFRVFPSLSSSQDASCMEPSQFLTRNLLQTSPKDKQIKIIKQTSNLVLRFFLGQIGPCVNSASWNQGCGIRASSHSGCCGVGGPVWTCHIQHLTNHHNLHHNLHHNNHHKSSQIITYINHHQSQHLSQSPVEIPKVAECCKML